MMTRYQHWFAAAVVGLGLCASVQAADPAATEQVTDARITTEQQLDKKFTDGKYSRQGADACLKCHDADSDKPATGIFHTPHGNPGNTDGPQGALQCETCHGPVGNHARNPRKGQAREPMITFGKNSPVPAEKQNSICLSCHTDTQRTDWHASEHAVQDMSCTSCHSLHKPDPMQNPQGQNQTCLNCHAEQKSAVLKRSSHPIVKGDMQCTSCHNPHSSNNTASLNKATINETCYECHAEKRGPFLTEHAPVSEDCSLCHTSHGSVNQSLLNKRIPQLCQECHSDNFKTDHVNVPNAAFGGNCLSCHSNSIHGTNHPQGLTNRPR